MIAQTKWGKKGIWAELISSQDHSGEYNTELRIYKGERLISVVGEGQDFNLQGDFDFDETEEKDEEGIPKGIIDNTLDLTVEDLIKLTMIMDNWLNEGDSELYESEQP